MDRDMKEEDFRELQEAYNQSVIAMPKKKRTCGPNCKLCQKEREDGAI
jgi:hypothetical protein